ncbi:glycosyltransferase [Vallitalea guaymasensis]|uniref:glycosyltransferase n=1 Tax=Vallitalea guaymasensis TaxID=1185412 RepID=UPI000DE4D98C|nr:glycosyltransferase family 2 protein [Vallitalea guaymasensis]
MYTISLCMIVKNEEDVLGNCLSSVGNLVDEIIIVDTGSTDKTKEIAKKFKAKIYDFKWINDFAAARNYSFSKATSDYILWLDADDVLLEEDIKKFKKLKRSIDKKIDAYSMFYNYAFDDKGNVILRFRRNRMVKRKRKYKWHGFVHEYIDVKGKVSNTDICITHKRVHNAGPRNINIYKQKIKEGYKLNPREIYYYGKELFDNKMYEEGIKVFSKYLEDNKGWKEDNIVACKKIADYYFDIKKYDEGRKYCFKTFEYDLPRGEACCRLGLSYLNQNEIEKAVFWYELATKLEKPSSDWGFINENTYTWLPHLQLCVCYYKLGDTDKSYEHNRIASRYNSNNESIKYNEKFFRELGYK